MVTEERLEQYGAMGTIIHKMAEMVLLNDTNPTTLYTECSKEWDIIQNGSLGLKPSDANPQAFMDMYREDFDWEISFADVEMTLTDDNMLLKGTLDLYTKYKGMPAICDWKTSRSYSAEKKDSYFKQAAAYAIMYEERYGTPIEALVIMPLNPNNKRGYGKPIVCTEIKKYKELFLKDLEQFNKLYRNNN